MDWIKADRQLSQAIRFFNENCLGAEREVLKEEQRVRSLGGTAGIFHDEELPKVERNIADLEGIVESLRAAQRSLRGSEGFREQNSLTDFLRAEE
ncbi:MAG: hypothetical protein ACYDAY_11170 [Candidatus Dormibacteria bacterium]